MSFVVVPEGSTATFQVKLSSQPSADVTITTSWVEGDSDIVVLEGKDRKFTTLNWDRYQTVTLLAVQDTDSINGTATIRCSASGLPDKDVMATEQDNNKNRPDLQVTGVDSSVWQSAEPGTVVDWSVVVKNNGPGYQWAGWTVEWYLSSDKKYQSTDILIGTETYSDHIGPKGSVSGSISAEVPDVTTAGQKYVIARVVNAGPDGNTKNDILIGKDPDWIGEVAPDGDEENDTRETAKDLGYVSGKWTRDNLTVDSKGDEDWYKFTTMGLGTKSHWVQIDFLNNEGDLALALYDADGTPVGPSSDGTKNTEKVSLAGLVDGDYYVKIWSPRGDVSRKYKLTMVAPAPPDLQPTVVDSSIWQSAEPGTVADWTVVVKNNGSGYQRADWTVEWYLSSDKKYQSTDTFIGTQIFSDDIAPKGSVSGSIRARVPEVTAAGQMYLIARVVNAGPDGNTKNDILIGKDSDWFGEVAPDVDEDHDTRETAEDLGYVSGKWTRDNLTVDSKGDEDWYKFTTMGLGTKSHWVQIDFLNNEGDLALALYDADGTPVGPSSDGTKNTEKVSLAGLVDGDYYVKIWSPRGDVSRKYKLTMVAPAPPDLQPTVVDSSIWQSAEPGTDVDWTVVVKNNGPGYQRADWTVEWYLSSDKKYQSTDTFIGTQTFSDDIAPKGSVSGNISAEVPEVTAAGQKYVIARVVNAGPDGNTKNDVLIGKDPDWIGEVAPDGDEENDTRETARDLGLVSGTWTRDGLTIDSVGDEDWYRFTTQQTGTSKQKVRIDFDTAEGDLALALCAADGSMIQQVDGTGKSEEIKLAGQPAGTYYLKVLSERGDVSRRYKLTVVG